MPVRGECSCRREPREEHRIPVRWTARGVSTRPHGCRPFPLLGIFGRQLFTLSVREKKRTEQAINLQLPPRRRRTKLDDHGPRLGPNVVSLHDNGVMNGLGFHTPAKNLAEAAEDQPAKDTVPFSNGPLYKTLSCEADFGDKLTFP